MPVPSVHVRAIGSPEDGRTRFADQRTMASPPRGVSLRLVDKPIFPGDSIIFDGDPPARTLIGNGVSRQEDRLIATKVGILRFDRAGAKVFVENVQKRYTPVLGDQVVGVILDKLSEEYRVDIGGSAPALLPLLAFDGATHRNRPNLGAGAIVYARVVVAHRHVDPELSGTAPPGVVSKDWMTGQSVFGELKGGTLLRLSTRACTMLFEEEGELAARLEAIGRQIPFEMAVGSNGRVWVNTAAVKDTVRVSAALKQAVREVVP